MTPSPSAPPMRSNGRPIALTVLVAALVLVPTTALASHNSVGAHVNVLVPDEVRLAESDRGELAPDVSPDEAPSFHPELDQPRPAPPDQSGERYRPSDGCRPWASYDDQDAYEADLIGTDACYVGFLDGQLEYMQFTQIFAIHRSEDLLYPANPSPEDPYCTGREDPDAVTGSGPLDQAIARLTRANQPECQPETHDQFLPGYLGVDTDLLEAPFQGTDPLPGAATTVGTQPGSGTLTLPLLVTPYVFLFGQPHPSNTDPSPHRAGEGLFGPNPLAGGSPIVDLDGACGDRTHQCRLLEPADLIAYDTYDDELTKAGVSTVGETARLCLFTPVFFYEHPKPDTALCGPQGRPVNQFLGTTRAGGLGVDGAPPTWASTLPGWYRASVMAPLGALGHGADLVDEYVDDPLPASVHASLNQHDYTLPTSGDTDGQARTAVPQVFAVNPDVPLPGSQLTCLAPNLLATGTGTQQIDPSLDAGVYGAYRADAIDTDVYHPTTHALHQPILDATHPIARPAIALAEETLPGASGDPDAGFLPDALEGPAEGTLERADPDADPEAEPIGPREFHRDQAAGIACTPTGELVVRTEPQTINGHRRVDVRLQANAGNDDQIPSFPQPPGVHPKDPTRSEEGLPLAPEDRRSTWRPDVYSLEGRIDAVLDANRNGQLDPCANAQAVGTVDPCPWRALWDAYNPACKGPDGQRSCQALLTEDGYDLDTGVGVYLVLETTGPTLVVDEDRRSGQTLQDRTRLVGESDPTARNCIVGTSTGFAPRLASLIGTTVEGLPESLCQAGTGETLVIEDAFDDQTADPARAGATVERGAVSAAIQWVPLAATPSAAEQATGLGTQDRVCLGGVFAVQEGTVAEDTADSLALTGTSWFQDCDRLASTG